MTLFDPPGAERAAARRLSLVRLSSELARSLGAIGRIAVDGEVHRPTKRPNGRIYFTLKDRAAQIDVSVPASRSRRARAVDGERVQVTGTLEWMNSWGKLQLVAEEVVPVGAGAVAAMIAEARRRLAADGLLDRPRRSIPVLPTAIGVICGSEAAVRADIESVVAARFPGYPMVFREVTVSGPSAVDSIIGALADLDRDPRVEVIVMARGGGDATQLLPFSDEDLCRAVCACATPVVAAIGHEGDRPLCDEVVDLRCGTPSLAAAAVVPDRGELQRGLDEALVRAAALATARLDGVHRRLAAVDRDRAVTAGIDRASTRLRAAAGRLALLHPTTRLSTAAGRLASTARELEALSPTRVLERGYAVIRTADGRVVRSADDASPGDRVDVQLARGRLVADVEEVFP